MTCTLDLPCASCAPTATSATTAGPAELSPALLRFVTDGLTATLDSYRHGQLAPHRFVWELTARINTLYQPPTAPVRRAVTRLRWITRDLTALHAELTAQGRTELTDDEQNHLTLALTGLRTALAELNPHTPPDPTGAAHPRTGTAPTLRVLRSVV